MLIESAQKYFDWLFSQTIILAFFQGSSSSSLNNTILVRGSRSRKVMINSIFNTKLFKERVLKFTTIITSNAQNSKSIFILNFLVNFFKCLESFILMCKTKNLNKYAKIMNDDKTILSSTKTCGSCESK